MQTLLTVLGIALVPAIAAAQPSQPPPPPGGGGPYAQPPQNLRGYHDRAGTPMIGFSIGLGGMESQGGPVSCPSCDYGTIGLELDAHVGGMLSNQFGLMLEVQANLETVEDDGYDSTTLTQSTAMIAGQYFVTPQLWIKAGIGAAHLSYDYAGGYAEEPIDDGAAIMGAVGYEVLSSRTFSIDLQARAIVGAYDGINDKITAATVGLGFNWYGFGHSGLFIRIR